MPDQATSFPSEFARIADAAPAPMWVTRLDRRRSFVNQAYADFLGVDAAAARDFDWRGIIHPDDVDRIVAASVAGEASLQPFALEGRYRRCDGQWRWLCSVSQPRFDDDGALIGFIGVAHDVTDAKAAEEELREREHQLAAVFNQTAAGLVQVDLQGRIIRANNRFSAIVGRGCEELLQLGLFEITHPDDVPANISLVESALGDHAAYSHDSTLR